MGIRAGAQLGQLLPLQDQAHYLKNKSPQATDEESLPERADREVTKTGEVETEMHFFLNCMGLLVA